MDRTYILHRIYTSENSAEHRDTQLSEMYPDVAGTKEAIEKELNRRIEYARRLMQSISYTKQYLPLILERCLIVR